MFIPDSEGLECADCALALTVAVTTSAAPAVWPTARIVCWGEWSSLGWFLCMTLLSPPATHAHRQHSEAYCL